MIIVEISVPAVDDTFEFKLNEDVSTAMVIDELCFVICEKEQCSLIGNKDDMFLYSTDQERCLSRSLSLYENGVGNGERLILL